MVINYETYAADLARQAFNKHARQAAPTTRPLPETRVCVVCEGDVCAPDDDTCGSLSCREVWYAEFLERR